MPDPVIFDWPLGIVPSGQVFYAPGQIFEGGFTGSGIEAISPEPGGRAFLEMSFNTLKGDSNSRLAGWLFSKASAIFRIPLYRSVQLVSSADLSVPGGGETDIPWQDAGGEGETLWDGDIGWGVDYGVNPTAAALEGTNTLSFNMSAYGRVLLPGHVIGYRDRAYMVDAITYDDDDAAVLSVNPPMRTDVVPSDDNQVTFRPVMLARMMDPAGFRAMFDQGKLIKPGNVIFAEVLI
jgi:hypothetical protein